MSEDLDNDRELVRMTHSTNRWFHFPYVYLRGWWYRWRYRHCPGCLARAVMLSPGPIVVHILLEDNYLSVCEECVEFYKSEDIGFSVQQ